MNWAERRNIYEGKSGQKAGSGAALSSGDRWAERRKKYNSGDIITPEQRQAQAQSLRRVQAQRRGQAQQYKAQETEHDKQQAEYNRLMGLDLEKTKSQKEEIKTNIKDLAKQRRALLGEFNRLSSGNNSGANREKLDEIRKQLADINDELASSEKQGEKTSNDYRKASAYQKEAENSDIINRVKNDKNISAIAETGIKKYENFVSEKTKNSDFMNWLYGTNAAKIWVPSWDKYTDEEKAVYGYLRETNEEKANEYMLETNKRHENEERQKIKSNIAEWAGSNFGTAAAASAGSILTNVGAPIDYIQRVAEAGATEKVYGRTHIIPTTGFSDIAGAMQSGVAEKIEENTGFEFLGANVAAQLYSIGMSAANSAALVAAMGPFATIEMSMQAAASATMEKIDQGLSDSQAIKYGTAAGVAEGLFEYLSIDKLLKPKNVVTVKQGLKELLAQAGVEASEEAFTTLANTISDIAINGDQSELRRTVAEYIAAGKSQKEAEWLAFLDWGGSLLWDAIGGFVSGGLLGGAKTVIDTTSSKVHGNMMESRIAASVVSDIDESEVQKRAAKYEKKGMSTEEAAQKAREDIQNEKAKKYTAQGMSAEEAASAVETDDIAVKSDNERLRGEILARGLKAEEGSEANIAARAIQEKLKSGESVSAEEWKGFIKSTREQVSLSETKNAIKEAARKSGESVADTDIDIMAAAMEKNFMGRNMTEAENKLIKGSEAAKKAYSELTGLDYETGEVIPEIVRKKEQANKQSVEAKIKNGLGKEITNYAGEDSSQGYKNTLSKTYKAYLSIVEHANAEDITQARAKIGAKDYAGYFEAFYEGGRSGEYTLETLKGLVKNDSAAAEALSVAYELGRSEGKSQGKKNAKARQAKLDEKIRAGKEKKAAAPKGVARSITKEELKTGAAKNAGAKSIDMKRHFSQKQRYSIAVMREFTKKTGVNIVFYQTEDGRGANGWYDRETDTIYIDIFSGFDDEQAMLRTLSHELTHFMEKYSPEHYEEYKQFLLDYYYGKDNGETLSRLIEQEKRLAPNRSAEYWQNEVVANASEMFINDESAMRALIGEHAGAAQTIDEWFKKMNYALRRAFKGVVTSGSAEADAAKELKANVETFSEAQRRWSALLKESVEAKKAVGTAEESGEAKFSMRVDSEGRELSEAQQEFFKDSKVRDDEGRLLTVYHGSDKEFFVFDRTKARANMDIQGSFFSPWEIDAQGYGGKVGEYYLNIVNPASEAMGYKALKKFQGQNGAGIKAREYLQSLGYDGVNNGGEEYIAFESNQIKSVTNQNPTENPDIRYSMRGRNADGIEVYETSDEIKSLPKKDKQKVFLDIMTNQYRGRTAKFIRNGHAYYATFDTADVEKNIYGDKKSDRKGWKAKINTGADGDIFELVENSTYSGSKPEKGKLIASHDGVLYWDYFIKTVQIDNVVYDLVANIRKKKDNSFVYGIQIRENKKIKASPPGGSLLRALNRVPNALQKQYTQNEAKSQQISEKNNEKSIIDDLGKVQYQLRIEDKNRLDILDRQETRLTADLKTLERAYAEAVRAEYERNIKPSEETSKRAAEINRKAADRYMNEVGAIFHVPAGERTRYLLPIINEIIDKGPAISENEGLIEQLYRMAYKHSAEYAVEGSENEKNLREYIRKTAIYVDPGTKGDVGDYEQFRKNNTGSLKLTGDTNALSIDEFYAEVKNAAPDIFSDTTDGAEQLYELSAFMKDRGRVESIGDYMNEDESVKWAMDGDSSLDTELDNLFDKTVGSFLYEASRKERERTNAARINRAMDNVRSAVSNYGRAQEYARAEGVLAGQMHQGAKDAAKLRTVTENYENRIKAYRNKLHEVREKRDAVLEARKEAFKNYRAERADSLNRSVLRKRIIKDARTLNTMLLNPTDNKHIPQELRGAVAGLLGNFTDNTSVFSRDKLERLKGAYSEIAKEDNDLNDLYDPDIAEYISKLEKRAEMENVVDGRRLSELSADELFYVQAVTEYFTHVVRDGNALFIDGRRRNISEIAAETISAAKKHGLKTYRGGALGEAANWADKYLNYDNITPVYFFNRMGGGMKRLFNDMLYNSQLKYAQDINEDQKFMAAIYEKYHVWGWTSANPKNKNDRLKFVTERREVLDMTRNEVLTAYVTYKRGKANGDGAIHMMEGGIVVKSKTSDNFFKKFRKSSKGIQLTYRDLRTMFGFLTAEQKACADAIVNYLTAVEGARRNETSMALYGYKKFNETYYFPYRVASDYVKSYAGQEVGPDGTKQVGASRMLKNMGSSKALNPNANAAIVIDDFFKIVAESMNDTARYHAFAVQQDNFMRVLNYKGTVDAEHGSTSVKQAIRDSFGAEGINYITGLMGDSFGGAVQLNNDNVFGKLFGKFKKTAVAANLSVAIQQPSAIVRATALIDGKYLLKTVKQKNVLDEMYDYSSTAFLKNMGRFDIGTGRSAEQYILKPELKGKEYLKQLFATGEYDTGELDDLTGFLSEKADWVTWGHIMNAVMAEIEDTTDLERGTEEFKRAAGRRFDEIVNATQVYDSILTKSPMMRSQNSLTQIVAAFKMEPTLSYNVFMDSIGERKTIPSASRGLISLAMTTFANALLKSLIGAMRDRDKDKTYLEKYAEKLVSNIWSDLIPILNLPGVSAISEAVQGFTTELPEMGMISDTVSAVNKAIKKIGNGDWGGALGDLTVALNLFGLPVRNIYRDISAIFNTAFDTKPLGDTSLKGVLDAALEGLEGESIVYGAGKALGLIDTSKTAGIKRAMKKGSYTEIRKATNKLIEEYVAEGKSKSDAKGYIKTALTNYWKPKYRNANEKERAKIRRALFDTGIYENTDAVVKMCNNWLKDD